MSDSLATVRKTTYGNNCKNLIMIQWYDEKLEPFLAIFLVWRNRCSALPRTIPYLLQGKHPPKTPVKIECDPTVKSKVKVLLS
jgi:hypothetical protein